MAPPSPLSRRRFLTAMGVTAGAVALGACGGGNDDDETTPDTGDGGDGGKEGGLVLVSYLGAGTGLFGTGQRNRVPFGLADQEGLLTAADTPDEVEVQVLGPDGAEVGAPITVRSHVEGLERAYFPLELTVDEPGVYTVRADLGGDAPTALSIEVVDAAAVAVLKPGDQLPALVTPTSADARGVDPICTDDPVCALHDKTVADLLAAQQPLALIVATPAFCKVAACGPVHDVFLSVIGDHPSVQALHLEVYLHPHVNTTEYAPAVTDLRLSLEPVAILVGADGVVTDRIDAIFDRAELDAALAKLS
jgi:hypothetical protein